MSSQVPGFREEIEAGRYIARIGGTTLSHAEMAFPVDGSKTIRIHPAPKNAGIGILIAVGLGAVVAIGLAATLLARPSVPDPNLREDESQNTGVYDGVVNVQEQGHPRALIYGRCRVGSVVGSSGITTGTVPYNASVGTGAFFTPGAGGGGGFNPFSENLSLQKGGKSSGGSEGATEEPNSLQSNATARIIDILGEGEILGLVDGLASVYLDGTPVRNADDTFNFKGITMHERVGTPDQTFMPGFTAAESTREIAREARVDTGPVVETIADPDINVARVTIRLNALSQQNTENGNITGSSVQFALDLQSNGGGFTTVVNRTISGKQNGPYQESFDIRLPAGGAPWSVRMRRITPDNDESTIQDATFFDLLTEVVEAKLTYPNCAMVGLQVDAQQFGSSIPSRGYEVFGRIIRVPSNYDPETRTYTGIWDGSFKRAYSNNSAWVIYDIMTNKRFGLGRFLDDTSINKWEMYSIGQYCDEMVDDGRGGLEPRYTFNGAIATRQAAKDLLQSIASSFRSAIYWGSAQVVLTQDRPKDPLHIVTRANVEDGDFVYSGSANDEKYSAFLGWWNDPDDEYRLSPVVSRDNDLVLTLGWKPLETTFVGVTSPGHARRLTEYIKEDQATASDSLSYGTSFNQAGLVPGDIIEQFDQERTTVDWSGRIASATAGQVTLDRDVIASLVPGVSYRLTWLDVTGSPITGDIDAQASIASGDIHSAQLTEENLPPAGSPWIIRSTTLAPRQWMIRGNSEGDGISHQIQAVSYDPGKHARVESGVNVDQVPWLDIPIGPVIAPGELTVTEYIQTEGNSVNMSLLMSWLPSNDPRVTSYDVQVRRPGQEWAGLASGPETSRELREIDPGDYVFRVRSVSSFGQRSPWRQLEQSLVGQTAPLSQIENIVILQDRQALQSYLSWDVPDDQRPLQYEVFFSAESDFAQATMFETAQTNRHIITRAGNYWVRAIFMDQRGPEGDPVAVDKDNLPLPEYADIVSAPASLRDLDPAASDLLDEAGSALGSINETLGGAQGILDAATDAAESADAAEEARDLAQSARDDAGEAAGAAADALSQVGLVGDDILAVVINTIPQRANNGEYFTANTSALPGSGNPAEVESHPTHGEYVPVDAPGENGLVGPRGAYAQDPSAIHEVAVTVFATDITTLCRVGLRGISETGTLIDNLQFSEADRLCVPEEGLVSVSFRIGGSAADPAQCDLVLDPSSAWVRPTVRQNGGTTAGQLGLHSIVIKDVTQVIAAQASEFAAALSASSASTFRDQAESFSSASQTSASTATTSAAQAGASQTQAASSETNAAGSAAIALSAQGVVAGLHNAARNRAAIAGEDNPTLESWTISSQRLGEPTNKSDLAGEINADGSYTLLGNAAIGPKRVYPSDRIYEATATIRVPNTSDASNPRIVVYALDENKSALTPSSLSRTETQHGGGLVREVSFLVSGLEAEPEGVARHGAYAAASYFVFVCGGRDGATNDVLSFVIRDVTESVLAGESAFAASGSADAASISSDDAEAAASAASSSETEAFASRGLAESAANASASHASTAAASSGAAGASATAAESSAVAAETARGLAVIARDDAVRAFEDADGAAQSAATSEIVAVEAVARVDDALALSVNDLPSVRGWHRSAHRNDRPENRNDLPDELQADGTYRTTGNNTAVGPKKAYPVNRIYRIIVDVTLVATDGGATRQIVTQALDSDFQDAPPVNFLVSTSPNITTLGRGTHEVLVTGMDNPPDGVLRHPAADAAEYFSFYGGSRSGGASAICDVHSLIIRDVTSEILALGAASAAASSASSAATDLTSSSAAAMAAFADRGLAETARGQAEGFAGQAQSAFTDADDARAASVAASGVSTEARDAANSAATRAGSSETNAALSASDALGAASVARNALEVTASATSGGNYFNNGSWAKWNDGNLRPVGWSGFGVQPTSREVDLVRGGPYAARFILTDTSNAGIQARSWILDDGGSSFDPFPAEPGLDPALRLPRYVTVRVPWHLISGGVDSGGLRLQFFVNGSPTQQGVSHSVHDFPFKESGTEEGVWHELTGFMDLGVNHADITGVGAILSANWVYGDREVKDIAIGPPVFDAANAAEIQLAQVVDLAGSSRELTEVIAEVQGRVTAHFSRVVQVPGEQAFIVAQADITPGGETFSNVGIGARRFSVESLVSGEFLTALEVVGLTTTFFGDINALGAMRFGSRRIPVALQSFVITGISDGESFSFGSDLTNIPDFEISREGLDTLQPGEDYALTVTNLTPTGGTLKARIVTPGGTTQHTTTSSGNGGANNPDRVAHKPDTVDASNGSYTFEVNMNLSHLDEGGQIFSSFATLEFFVRPAGGAWTSLGTASHTSLASGGGLQSTTGVFVRSFGGVIGRHGSQEFGVSLVGEGPGEAITGLTVTYNSTTQSNERSATPGNETATIRIIPQNA